jgi:hypothetical protein
MNIKDRKLDQQELVKEVLALGGKPSKKSMWHCFEHQDATASAQIKKSANGLWYYTCYTCGTYYDCFDLEARRRNVTIAELFSEYNKEEAPKQYYYKTIEELIDSIDDVVCIEEINKYSNPETGNLDLVTIRYRIRGGNKKEYCQSYETPKGFIRRRPKGLLPLFNRIRMVEDPDSPVIYAEGEGCVRELTRLGFLATTGSGGASNAYAHDYSPLAGRRVFLWADNDLAGTRYMEQVREKLLELDPVPEVFEITVPDEQSEGDDVKDLCARVVAEGGTDADCKSYVEDLITDAAELNRLDGLEDFLEKMRSGEYTNLPIEDFPMLTQEAALLIPKRVGVVYGGAGFGKSLFVGKLCDDLLLEGHKVVRLHLEDELEQYLTRSLAQRTNRAEICIPKWHKENPVESKLIYEQFKPTLEEIVPSIVAGEGEVWNDQKILDWIAFQLKLGKELIVVDPISVIMDNQVWLTTHRLIWGAKKLLSSYPNGRIIFVSHSNSENEIAGGQAMKRFASSAVLLLKRYPKPKQVELIDSHGELKLEDIDAGITIVKSRYGTGFPGMEIAVRLNKSTLCMEELGIVTREVKEKKDSYRDISVHEL